MGKQKVKHAQVKIELVERLPQLAECGSYYSSRQHSIRRPGPRGVSRCFSSSCSRTPLRAGYPIRLSPLLGKIDMSVLAYLGRMSETMAAATPARLRSINIYSSF